MKFPNKLYSYKESILFKFPPVLNEIEKKPIKISELYMNTKNTYTSIQEFIEILICLIVLEKIAIDWDKELVTYVKRNQMW